MKRRARRAATRSSIASAMTAAPGGSGRRLRRSGARPAANGELRAVSVDEDADHPEAEAGAPHRQPHADRERRRAPDDAVTTRKLRPEEISAADERDHRNPSVSIGPIAGWSTQVGPHARRHDLASERQASRPAPAVPHDTDRAMDGRWIERSRRHPSWSRTTHSVSRQLTTPSGSPARASDPAADPVD